MQAKYIYVYIHPKLNAKRDSPKMQKLKIKCEKLKLVLPLAALLMITPLVWTSLRFKYLYLIVNILIVALGAEAGLLSFFPETGCSFSSPCSTETGEGICCGGVEEEDDVEDHELYDKSNLQAAEDAERRVRGTNFIMLVFCTG